MTDKKTILKKENNTNSFTPLVEKKIEFFKDIIEKTIIHVQKNKFLDILGISDVGICIDTLGNISKKIEELNDNKIDNESLINQLQTINNDLSIILKNYGTESLEDLLMICFGNNNKIINSEKEQYKFNILEKFFHPTSYKLANKKEDLKMNKNSDVIKDNTTNFTCYDISTSYKQFHMKVYGVKILVYNAILKKNIVIVGILDDIIIIF